MACVVFMRGVNVGGHKSFRPAALARELAAYGAVNVGGAGTFVIRKPVGRAVLRAELLRRLPFTAEMMICPARDLIDLTGGDAFGQPTDDASRDAQRFVSVLAKRPRSLPPLPLFQPAGDGWQVKVVGVRGPFALSLWRRTGTRVVYPNDVVERHIGVSATTRNWNTISAIADLLNRG